MAYTAAGKGVLKKSSGPPVTKISAKIRGCKGKRLSSVSLPEGTFESTSADANADGFTFVRGSDSLALTSDVEATWTVAGAHGYSGGMPTLDPASGTASSVTLKLDTAGSFAVTASSGGKSIVLVVTVVWVEVDISASSNEINLPVADSKHYTSSAIIKDAVTFTSGLGFDTLGMAANDPHNNGWSAKVNVKLHSVGTQGFDKIKLQYLQNLVQGGTIFTGKYSRGGTATLTFKSSVPALDAHGAALPGWTGPFSNPSGVPPSVDSRLPAGPNSHSPFFFSTKQVIVSKVSDDTRQMELADTPSNVFDASHHFQDDTFASVSEDLESISGSLSFRAAIASFSSDAPNMIVAHADAKWQANFAGTVKDNQYSGTKGTAKTTGDSQFNLINGGGGGQPADDAGFEIFEPIIGDNGNPAAMVTTFSS